MHAWFSARVLEQGSIIHFKFVGTIIHATVSRALDEYMHAIHA